VVATTRDPPRTSTTSAPASGWRAPASRIAPSTDTGGAWVGSNRIRYRIVAGTGIPSSVVAGENR
jgi:hypothetical protein